MLRVVQRAFIVTTALYTILWMVGIIAYRHTTVVPSSARMRGLMVNRQRLFKLHDTSLLETQAPEQTDLDREVRNGTPVTWTSDVSASVTVKEIKRSTEEYMALPASQYSVLSADQVMRLSDTEFKIVLGTLNFFGTKISPILYVTVNVYADESTAEIIVTGAETTGSEMANAINGTFSIAAINKVSTGVDKKGRKILASNTNVKIDVLVPKSKLPISVIRTGGNFVIQSSMNIVVPTFVRILASDFKKWSAGDNERAAVEGASLDLQ